MIVAQITAGLGNQLFQYATARGVSLRAQLPLRFDLTYYTRKPNRAYRLDAYGLPAQVATGKELARYFTPLQRFPYVRGIASRVNGRLPFRWKRIIQEASPRFDARLLEIGRPVYLCGFWQCERYFLDYAETIREELTLRTEIPPCYRDAVRALQTTESVALVVRRGDYLGIPNTQGICTLDYYRAACAAMQARVGRFDTFVFSDDIPWCREHLGWLDRATFVANETPDRPEEHLRVMSLARHFILANSSFAWWSAWLSTHPAKLVFAPKKWMQCDDNLQDILPAVWIRLPPE